MRPASRLPSRPIRRGLLVLVAVQLVLDAVHVVGHLTGDVPRLLDLDGEANVTAWWSSTLLLAGGMTAAALFLVERRLGGAPWPLLALGLGLVGLSLEEVARVHESVGARVEVASTVADWTLVYLPVLAVGCYVVLRVMRELPRRLAVVVALGLAAFAVGIATEMSLLVGEDERARTGPADPLAVALEENAEFVGTLLIGTALVVRLLERLPLVLTVAGPPARPPAGRPPASAPAQAPVAVGRTRTPG